MKLYFAGNTGLDVRERYVLSFIQNRLLSYYIALHFNPIKMMNKVNLFLDSGAFSAKTQGVNINIEDYIAFIKKHRKYINVYANLDVIGNPDATLNNQKIMEEAGLRPIPVFHYSEDPEKYLKPLIKKYDYIAVGGMVGSSRLMLFLDSIFSDY